LKEVSATNRTHPADYENAVNENTALLKVHQQLQSGRSAEVTLENGRHRLKHSCR
jgi:seryl-tRNA(Sec) selenium transferase